MTIFRVQPSEYVDNMAEDGHEFTKMPYPFYVDEDGLIGRQDFWQGYPLFVVGFQKDLHVQQVDLWWSDAVKEPDRAKGMYLVTKDADMNYSSQQTAVSYMEEIE